MTDAPAATPQVRPWHYTDDPWEAMYQWVQEELAKLRPQVTPEPEATSPSE
jgi:hypothetical protein